MAFVNAEYRLVARFWPVEVAGAAFAFSPLAFLRNRRENSRRMKLIKFLDHEAVSNRLIHRLQDSGIDGPDYATAHVASERDLIPGNFGHDETCAIDTSGSVRQEREM